jgi:hypothetical protein
VTIFLEFTRLKGSFLSGRSCYRENEAVKTGPPADDDKEYGLRPLSHAGYANFRSTPFEAIWAPGKPLHREFDLYTLVQKRSSCNSFPLFKRCEIGNDGRASASWCRSMSTMPNCHHAASSHDLHRWPQSRCSIKPAPASASFPASQPLPPNPREASFISHNNGSQRYPICLCDSLP